MHDCRPFPRAPFVVGLAALLISGCQGEFTLPLPDLAAASALSEVELSSEGSALEAEFVGPVDSMSPAQWTVGDQLIAITDETEIVGLIEPGDIIKVHATLGEGDALTALQIELAEEQDGAGEGDLEDHDADIKFVGVVQEIGDDFWVIDGQTVGVTADSVIGDGIEEGDLVRVEAKASNDGSLIALEIKADEDEGAGGGDLEDHDEDIKFVGVVQEIGDGFWVIDGQMVSVTADSVIGDGIEEGDLVRVQARASDDGSLIALEIEANEDDDVSDSGFEDDENDEDHGLDENEDKHDEHHEQDGDADGHEDHVDRDRED